jgi:hypothetical protein
MARHGGAVRSRGRLAQRGGVTLAQPAVDDTTNASPVALAWLRPMGLEGRSVTRDAWLPPRQMAQPIVDAGGDDVLGVNAHQPP